MIKFFISRQIWMYLKLYHVNASSKSLYSLLIIFSDQKKKEKFKTHHPWIFTSVIYNGPFRIQTISNYVLFTLIIELQTSSALDSVR